MVLPPTISSQLMAALNQPRLQFQPPSSFVDQFKSTGHSSLSMADMLIHFGGVVDPSSFLMTMSTCCIQEFPNQKRSDHPPRFSVHFFTNIGSELSAKVASTTTWQESALIDSVVNEYKCIFSDDIHKALSAKTYCICGLETTMQHPMSFTVLLTGKQQKVDDKPSQTRSSGRQRLCAPKAPS